ncbi:hypothetical protein PIB30_099173, partial [Stylosanthes scabra]|nr:hypothetical protein [Stylosanthes scabra]
TILHVLLKSKEDTLKEIEQSTYHQNFSQHMILRKMEKLRSSKSSLVRILLIYLQKHYLQRDSKNLYTRLACAASVNYI